MFEIILLLTGTIAALSTFIANNTLKLGAVKASAGLSFIVALLCLLFDDIFKDDLALQIQLVFFGASFVGMQAFEWTKLIMEGVRPWENPFGAPQFGSIFFMITGFHGTHVTIGVIFLFIMARKAWRGDFDTGRRGFFTSQKSHYEAVEIMGLYWHFVDLVWVFIFAFFYLW